MLWNLKVIALLAGVNLWTVLSVSSPHQNDYLLCNIYKNYFNIKHLSTRVYIK